MRILILIAAMLMAAPATAAEDPTRFSVAVEGEGPDIIFIPGLMSDRAVFDGAVASLKGDYRAHRIQIAGFAGEPARGNAGGAPILPAIVEELHAYIEAHDLDRPEIVGHSLGGLLALMLADAHPQDVGGLLIVDALPFYGMLFDPAATAASVEPQAAAFRDMMLAMSDEQYRAQQPRTLASLVKDEKGRADALAWSLASDRAIVAKAVYEDMITDIRPKLAGIAAPITVAYAVNDFATEERVGSLYRSGYADAPNVSLVPVEDSYHFIMLDQPARFAEILQDFLTGVE